MPMAKQPYLGADLLRILGMPLTLWVARLRPWNLSALARREQRLLPSNLCSSRRVARRALSFRDALDGRASEKHYLLLKKWISPAGRLLSTLSPTSNQSMTLSGCLALVPGDPPGSTSTGIVGKAVGPRFVNIGCCSIASGRPLRKLLNML